MNQDASQQSKTVFAGFIILLSVVLFSGQPIVVAWGDGNTNPFLFNSAWRAGLVFGGLLFLLAFYRSSLFNLGVILRTIESAFPFKKDDECMPEEIKNNRAKRFALQMVKWAIPVTVIGNFDFAIFSLADRYVDISVTAIVFEIWPCLIIFIAVFVAEQGRYRQIKFETVLLLLFGFLGVWFITLSETGGLSLSDGSGYGNTIVGVALSLTAAILTALSAFSFRWSSNLAKELPLNAGRVRTQKSAEVFYLVIAFVICNAISAPINFVIGLISFDGSIELRSMLIAFVFGGVLIQASGNVLWRFGNATTPEVGINAISYATPIFSLVWLFVFFGIELTAPGYLVIGATAIVTTNLLINFEAEIRLGFKALLVSAVSIGTFVYLRDEIFEWLNVTTWYWTGAGYFEALALSATVFTLLLAFRVARLVSRTSDEAARTFSIFRRANRLVQRNVLRERVKQLVLDIDSAQESAKLNEAYTKILELMVAATPKDGTDREVLNQIEADLDALVRSKQVNLVLGEQFALVIIALITIALALLTRPPESEPWPSLLVDMFAMLVSSVIVFLLAYVIDLDQERGNPKIEFNREKGLYKVIFSDIKRRSSDQWVSGIVGVGVISVFAGLLAYKWLGWFSWIG